MTLFSMEVKPGSIYDKVTVARKYSRPSLSQTQLGKALGLSQSAISMFEKGERDPRPYFAQMSGLMSIPLSWWDDGEPGPPPLAPVSTGFGSAPGSSPPAPSTASHIAAEPGVGRRKFPLVGVAGCASFPLVNEDPWPGDFMEFADDLYRPERFVIQLKGDSMTPRFEHGDFLLVQPSSEVEPGLIAIAHNGEYEYVAKVLRLGEGRKKELRPINSDYETLTPNGHWRIVGYAVGWRRERGPGRYIEEGDNAGLRP